MTRKIMWNDTHHSDTFDLWWGQVESVGMKEVSNNKNNYKKATLGKWEGKVKI